MTCQTCLRGRPLYVRCYRCYLRRRAISHIAARAALLFGAVVCAVIMLGIAWQWAGRIWR